LYGLREPGGWRTHHHYGSGELAHRREHARRAIEVWERIWGYYGSLARGRPHDIVERIVLGGALWRVAERVREHVGGRGRLGSLFDDWREVMVVAWRDGHQGVSWGLLTW
jgi:hypothetical protein